jgi:hypothetical protein
LPVAPLIFRLTSQCARVILDRLELSDGHAGKGGALAIG